MLISIRINPPLKSKPAEASGETHTFTDQDPPDGKAFYRLSTE